MAKADWSRTSVGSNAPARPHRSSVPQFLPLLSWLLLAGGAAAATPREELLRLVPEDVGFCLVLENFRDQGKALANSPFVKQFQSSPLADQIRSAPEIEKLTELDRFLQRTLDLTTAQLRDDLLGDALVLAYRPGPLGKPDEEEGLFLLWARDARLLAQVVEQLNTLQKESGDLTLEARTHHGATYYRRVERTQANFYYLHGSVLAFAPREGILRQVIERIHAAPREGESPVARQFRLLGVTGTLAALWINPRAFDAALEQNAATAGGGRATALRTLCTYWKALEGIALTATLDEALALGVTVRAKVEALPPTAQRFLQTAAEPSELWQRFPADALLTVAGRVDIPALMEIVGSLVPDEARLSLRTFVEATVEAILGKGVVQELLSQLGPDWGFCMLTPPAGHPGWLPYLVGALRIRSGTSTPPAGLVAWNALNALATLAVFHGNHAQPGPFRLTTTVQENVEVRALVNEEQFPPGLQPAFALKGGYLVLASSPEAIRQFRAAPAEQPAAAGAGVPLLQLSLRNWCAFLRKQREALVADIAGKKQISKELVNQHLDHLLAVLQFFERIEVNQRSDPGRVTWTLRVQTTKPLR